MYDGEQPRDAEYARGALMASTREIPVPETPWSKFRLSADTLADLDALAASNGGNRSQALREAIAYWRAAVEAAGRQNAEELSQAEWMALWHTGDPADPGRFFDDPGPVRDWSRLIALKLDTMYDFRPGLIPPQREVQRTAKKLARKIAEWGPVRAYALMTALRYIWRQPEEVIATFEDVPAFVAACAAPAVWLNPTVVGRE